MQLLSVKQIPALKLTAQQGAWSPKSYGEDKCKRLQQKDGCMLVQNGVQNKLASDCWAHYAHYVASSGPAVEELLAVFRAMRRVQVMQRWIPRS